MAFWRTPEIQPDHADRDARAAVRIAPAFRERNTTSSEALRMRMNLSTGEVIVGTVGSKNCMNYTVVGEAVNVANRLSAAFNIETFGEHKIQGIKDQIKVCRLEHQISVYH